MINNYMLPEKEMNNITNTNNRDKDKEIISKNQRSFFLSPNQQNIQNHNIIFENHPVQTRLDTRTYSSPSNDLKHNASTNNLLNNYSNSSFLNDINSINTRQSSNKDINNISYIPNPTTSFQPISQRSKLFTGDKIIPHNTRNN